MFQRASGPHLPAGRLREAMDSCETKVSPEPLLLPFTVLLGRLMSRTVPVYMCVLQFVDDNYPRERAVSMPIGTVPVYSLNRESPLGWPVERHGRPGTLFVSIVRLGKGPQRTEN